MLVSYNFEVLDSFADHSTLNLEWPAPLSAPSNMSCLTEWHSILGEVAPCTDEGGNLPCKSMRGFGSQPAPVVVGVVSQALTGRKLRRSQARKDHQEKPHFYPISSLALEQKVETVKEKY